MQILTLLTIQGLSWGQSLHFFFFEFIFFFIYLLRLFYVFFFFLHAFPNMNPPPTSQSLQLNKLPDDTKAAEWRTILALQGSNSFC